MPHDALAAALAADWGSRCPDGCDTTRALFAAAIEREVAGYPPDTALYARLERCRACAAEYVAVLDLAYALDGGGTQAADAPPLRPPTTLPLYRPRTEDDRRVAEDTPEYDEDRG